MRKLKFTWNMLEDYARATGLVFATVVLILIIGRDTLGQAVIGLLYLVPVGYSAARWGQWPGICAAVMAFLTFDFFFILPYYTFTVGSLEGWLLLIIFLTVAIVIVGRIQSGLNRAQQREREALLLYELSTKLIGLYGPEAVARTLAEFLNQLFQAAQVQVTILPKAGSVGFTATSPAPANLRTSPDRALPLYSAANGLIGEILLWANADGPALPTTNERFLQTLATLGALTLERARLTQWQIPVATGV
jgi:K+-sensing histidine kinase KdpD